MDSNITKMNLSSFYEGTPLVNADITWENNGESPLDGVFLNIIIGHYDPSTGTIQPLAAGNKIVSLPPYSSIISTISNMDISKLIKGTYDVVAYITREGVQISPSFLDEEVLVIIGPQYSALINSVSFSS